MPAPIGQLDDAARKKSAAEQRAAYVADQQLVQAAIRPRRPLPARVIGWALLTATLALFATTVVGYLRNPQESGAVNLALPTLVMGVGLLGAWFGLGPVLWESRSPRLRARNLALAAVVTLVLIPTGIALVVSLASLLADLLSNFV
jgi:hypothetical protein